MLTDVLCSRVLSETSNKMECFQFRSQVSCDSVAVLIPCYRHRVCRPHVDLFLSLSSKQVDTLAVRLFSGHGLLICGVYLHDQRVLDCREYC